MSSVHAELAWGKQFEHTAANAFVAKTWPNAQLVAAPAFADLDFLVVKAAPEGLTLLAFLEVKARRISSTRYDSTIVAWRKHEAARLGRVAFKIPTVCLVVFTDTVASFDLHKRPAGKHKVVRFDRPGVAVEHAIYFHKTFAWHPELREQIQKGVAANVE